MDFGLFQTLSHSTADKKKETRFWIRDAPLLRAQTRNIFSELIFTGSKNVFYTDVYSGFLQFILFFYFDM